MARKSKRLLRKSRIRNTRSKRKLTKRRIRPRKKIKTRKRRRKKRKLVGGAAGDPNSIVEKNNAHLTQLAAQAAAQAAAEEDIGNLGPEDPEEEFVPPGPNLFAQPAAGAQQQPSVLPLAEEEVQLTPEEIQIIHDLLDTEDLDSEEEEDINNLGLGEPLVGQ